ncbi:hypothetical protein TeGR_g5159 [Tetraparma gracilis]|uniref:Uncharacterized protein n=1 Tax=Tetraparma gracilis TaxID=2962635 RepID=A0ABQ6MR30_9STRA|nr:hypothetical protein TeGR_g5159 [Tetraparma gracilis]
MLPPLYLLLLLPLLLLPPSSPLSPPVPRRAFLAPRFLAALPLATLLPLPSPALPNQVSPPPSVAEARAQFQAASKTLDTLLSDYPSISAKGGDEIRRYLGTVGTSSPLFGFPRLVRALQDSASDPIEFTEASSDFLRLLSAADGQAYSSMFVEFSAAKGTTQDYYGRALEEIEGMKTYMVLMEKEL